jgi:hypothetical protein
MPVGFSPTATELVGEVLFAEDAALPHRDSHRWMRWAKTFPKRTD